MTTIWAPILTAIGGVSGQFATTAGQLPSLGAGKRWLIDYNPTSVVLVVAPQFEANFDEDGDVDGADLAKWTLGFGDETDATHTQGDANADGDVDGADVLVWQRQLGLPAAASAAAAGVAEPTSAALVLIGCIVLRPRNGRPPRHVF